MIKPHQELHGRGPKGCGQGIGSGNIHQDEGKHKGTAKGKGLHNNPHTGPGGF
jgi:hypothetical protein